MALNKNHEFEDLNGVKCGIVERNAKPERVAFLKGILEFNGFEVVTVPSPPPKVAVPPRPAVQDGDLAQSEPPASAEAMADTPLETFTIGVTDYTFNPINAIFGRQLKTREGHFVTLAYWNQEKPASNDEIPYFDNEETWK